MRNVYWRLHLMSLYEERQLLKKMNMAADAGPLPPELHRLRRKLIVRQVIFKVMDLVLRVLYHSFKWFDNNYNVIHIIFVYYICTIEYIYFVYSVDQKWLGISMCFWAHLSGKIKVSSSDLNLFYPYCKFFTFSTMGHKPPQVKEIKVNANKVSWCFSKGGK